MGTTKQGAFEMKYHHIDAPTKQDDEYGREHHKRILSLNDFRTPLLEYLSDKPWIMKRKLDGENLRIMWDGEQALWNGKSDNFQCSSALTDYMNNTFLEEIFEEKFGRDKRVYIFGEHMGPKSQGNELGLGNSECVIYDVKVNGTWLKPMDIISVAGYFGCKTCYDFMGNIPMDLSKTLSEYIAEVSLGIYEDWEGIVCVPLVECCYPTGERVICKIKNKDYLKKD